MAATALVAEGGLGLNDPQCDMLHTLAAWHAIKRHCIFYVTGGVAWLGFGQGTDFNTEGVVQ